MPPQGAYLVTRTLKVTGMVRPQCAAVIAEALGALAGMRQVEADWTRNVVTTTYDLQRMRIQDVEKRLAEIGYPPDPGFFQRKRRDWLHFTEQNEANNLKHVGHCCSKPPQGPRVKPP